VIVVDDWVLNNLDDQG